MKSFLELLLILVILPHTANTACTNPAADVGSMIYNTTEKVFQGCTQSQGWVAFHEPLPDTTPDAFGFVDQTDVAISTPITSNSVTINGIDAATAVSISGDGSPQFRIDGGSWVSSGTINNGQTLEIQLTSSSLNSDTFTATITVGDASSDWLVTTEDAAVACAGTEVGGYCWYYTASDEDCDTICASHGGCDISGIRDYTGSAGTISNCQAVLDAVGADGDSVSTPYNSNTAELGCLYTDTFPAGKYRNPASTTTCGSSFTDRFRVCSCNE